MADDKLAKAAISALEAIQNPTPDKVRSISVTAAEALLATPEIREALSIESSATLSALTTTAATLISSVSGFAKIASSDKLSAKAKAAEITVQAFHTMLATAPQIAAIAGAGVGAAVGGAAAGVGAAVLALFAAAAPLNAELAAQAEARAKRYEEGLKFLDKQTQILLRPTPTGPRGEQRPADLFAFQDWTRQGLAKRSGCADYLSRPLVGMALMRLTESGLHTFPVRPGSDVGEEPESDPEDIGACYGGAPLVSRTYYQMWLDAVRKQENAPKLGIPEDRRRVFEMLRRAINVQYGQPGTDGGAALWTTYLDLLKREFDEGHLTESSVATFLRCTVDWDFNTPKVKFISCKPTTFAALGAGAIVELVETWRRTVEPIYVQDVSAREAASKLLVDLTRLAGIRQAIGPRVPAAYLVGISVEVQKQLGVSPRPTFLTAAERKRAVVLKSKGLSPRDVAATLAAERSAPVEKPRGGGGKAALIGLALTLPLVAGIGLALGRKGKG